MNFNNFTIKSQEAIQKAVDIAKGNGQQSIEPVHLLKGVMAEGDSLIKFLFQKVGANLSQLSDRVDNAITSLPKVSGGEPYLSCRKPLTCPKTWAISTSHSKPC